MKKLTKNQINMIAIIHAASVLRETDFFMFEGDSEVCSDDQYKIIQKIGEISQKLAKEHPTNLGSTENIVEYVKSRK